MVLTVWFAHIDVVPNALVAGRPVSTSTAAELPDALVIVGLGLNSGAHRINMEARQMVAVPRHSDVVDWHFPAAPSYTHARSDAC